MPVIIKCPNVVCGKTIPVPDHAAGQSVLCPECRETVWVAASSATTAVGQGMETVDVILVKCPACGEPVSHGADACTICGFVLDAGVGPTEPPPALCINPACGAANPAGAHICGRCDAVIPIPVGTLLHGRYRIEKNLKSGEFGAVYRAVDIQQDNRPVAVKDMINKNPKEARIRLTFFRREVLALRALEHVPIVPRLYDVHDQGQTVRLVMELIPGQDLKAVLEKNNNVPFPIALVIEWGKSICDVLEAMHNLTPPMIHRDLKPENIMLLEDRRSIKMIDFGTARDLAHTEEARTGPKTRVYTEGYAPLEQVIGKPEERSDIYALAATLYHLVTGVEPQRNVDLAVDLQNRLNDPHVLIPAPDRWFYELLRVNLAEDVRQRFSSAAKFKAALVGKRAAWEEPPPPPVPVDPLAALRSACLGSSPDWMMIHYLASEARRGGHLLPADLARMASEAEARSNCAQQLQLAFADGRLEKIVEAYKPDLLDDWSAYQEEVARARQACSCWRKLLELRALQKSSLDGKAFLDRWIEYAPEMANWPADAEPLRQLALNWEASNRALEKLIQLVQAKSPSERSIALTWDSLEDLGGHPDAEPYRERARQANLRAACLERLPSRGHPESEHEDEEVRKVWDEALLQDCPEAQAQRDRYEQARERWQVLADLDVAIAQADQAIAGELAIRDVARRLPPEYVHRHVQRVAVAEERLRVARLLEKAATAKPQSDHAIAAAWEHVQKAGLRLGKRATARCQLAEERHRCLLRLANIDRKAPLDRQDQQWQTLWNTKLLAQCTDADPARAAHAKACKRIAAWQALEQAVKAKDLEHLLELAANPLLANYPPVDKIKGTLQDLTQQAKALARVRELLNEQDVATFVEQIDFDYVRSHPQLYLPYREALEEILTRWLRESQPIRAGEPLSIQQAHTGLVVVRWTWRFYGRISYCQVAVSSERFYQTVAETGGETMTWDVDSHRRAGGGIELAPPPGKRRLFVTVWPVIELGGRDLGWGEPLLGPPLHLGPIKIQLPSPA